MIKILAVDDNDDALFALERTLIEQGFSVSTAGNGAQAVEKAVTESPDLILMDINMPVMDGYEAVRRLKADPQLRFIPIVLLTSRDELDDVLQGFESGANDYIQKPFRREELLARIRAALRTREIYRELDEVSISNRELRRTAGETFGYANIVGKSAVMRDVFKLIDKVKDADVPVLIGGESGTGKELVAAAIHYNGFRKEKNFVAQNCSSFGEHLLESELFGHVRGAFTGAVRDKAGLLEVADGGTFFLDELGDMNQTVQARLLRFLEDGTFLQLGSTKPKKVDVRVVAATNKNLKEMVEKGTFREDLYYRLNVVSIELPPLRARKEDLPDLISHFMQSHAQKKGREVLKLSLEALQLLCDYSWPGNVRELRNEIDRVNVLCGESGSVDAGLLSPQIKSGKVERGELPAALPPAQAGLNAAVALLERSMLEAALKRLNWNKSEAARELGISRSSLIAKVQAYNIKAP